MATLQSRLGSLITAIGADMKEALTNRTVKLQTIGSDPAVAGYLAKTTVNYATSGTSSTVFEVWYTGDATDSSLASFWLNENGAPRAAMPKPSDVALKLIGWGLSGQTGHTFMIEQRASGGSGSRTSQWGINKDGNPVLGANEVVGANVVVISAASSVPPTGTPPCVVFKKRT